MCETGAIADSGESATRGDSSAGVRRMVADAQMRSTMCDGK
jgi:hypothetical protein